MNLKEKIEFYAGFFESIKKEDNNIIILKENAPEELKKSVFRAHGDRLCDDYVYDWYDSILSNLSDYDIEKIDDVENYRGEIVDGLVDPYTAGLTKWLNNSVYNTYYLTEALEEFAYKDGFKLLAIAQYKAIDEVYGYVIELLQNAEREENKQ